MGVLLQEQETTVNFYRDSDIAEIYTSDRTVMTKLDKLAENESCPDWGLVKCIYEQDDGSIAAKIYKTKKKLVSFRSCIVVRDLTEEQLDEYRERARHMQQKRHDKMGFETGNEREI